MSLIFQDERGRVGRLGGMGVFWGEGKSTKLEGV